METATDIELTGHFTFGRGGTVTPYLREGWWEPERGFTWSRGTRSHVRLPFRPSPGNAMVEMSLSPLLLPPMLPEQRVAITVNSVPVGTVALGGHWNLGFDVPPEAIAQADTLDIVLECPDATSPAAFGTEIDERQLGICMHEILVYAVPERAPYTPRLRAPLPGPAARRAEAVRGLTGLSIADLAEHFESLGHNCEFGLAQRQMGSALPGLLRFGGIPPNKMVEGLDTGFDGLTEPGNLMTYVAETAPEDRGKPGEIIVRDRRYSTNFHSETTLEDNTPEEVLKRYYRHFTFLSRKLIEDMEEGHKIFVFQHRQIRDIAFIRPILNVLRDRGPSVLLFVSDDNAQPPGSVQQLDTDLFQGWISQLAPLYAVQKLDLDCWIQICANTYRLWRESGYGAAS